LLTDLGIDGYVTIGIFGMALFHALATAPTGIAGQISVLVAWLSDRLSRGRGR
jgi:branched-chain amino acid transport system permease protein